MRRFLLFVAGLAAFALPASAGTLDDVRARDRLVCGVGEGLRGFYLKDEAGVWHGFDVDFCRAVATATLGDGDKVDFVPLTAAERFDALAAGKVDLVSRNSSWTMSRDLELGVDFAGISYYDGQGFLVPALYGMSSPLELAGADICLVKGTTTGRNATAFFAAAKLSVSFKWFDERSQARAAYENGECDAYTADRSALAAERSLLASPDDHVVLRDVISKEPLGPVTREDDPRWTELVRWTLFALINAEEQGLRAGDMDGSARRAATDLGLGVASAFGLEPSWLARVLATVGNYGEIFDRNLGEDTPIGLGRGLNALWTRGGLLYAPPMQ